MRHDLWHERGTIRSWLEHQITSPLVNLFIYMVTFIFICNTMFETSFFLVNQKWFYYRFTLHSCCWNLVHESLPQRLRYWKSTRNVPIRPYQSILHLLLKFIVPAYTLPGVHLVHTSSILFFRSYNPRLTYRPFHRTLPQPFHPSSVWYVLQCEGQFVEHQMTFT